MLRAMIGGLGLFFSFGVSLGTFALIAFLGAGDIGGAIAGAIIIIMSIVLSPILATIVGAIIGNNYDRVCRIVEDLAKSMEAMA